MADNQERSRKAGITVVAILLGGTLAAGSLVGQAASAKALAPEATAALAQAGITGVDVTFKGREAYLEGTGATQAELEAAKQVVESVPGVRWARTSGGVDPSSPTEAPPPTTSVASAPTSTTSTPSPSSTTVSPTAPSPTTASPTTASPTTPSPTTPVTVDPRIGLTRGTGGLVLTGTVASQADADALTQQIERVFGQPATSQLRVDPDCAGSVWYDGFTSALAKMPAITDGSLSVDGQEMSVGGTVATNDDLMALEQALKGLPMRVDNSVAVTPAPPPPAGLSADQIAQVNNTVVNFHAGVYALDDEGRANLDAVLPLLQASSDRIVVRGYLSGKPEPGDDVNSTRRAQVVADYLVANGIDAARLTVTGMGTADQVADNSTAAGRYANQRTTLTIEGSN